ncbi:MAG: diacylglycerol kinase family lipid kinase [Saprospiraceae bacterium]|nr:diacylglycerol kinase family lipid kinase [Saprospiraceae bacterium]
MNGTTANWYIIINPAASGGKAAKLWPSIERDLLAAGVSFSTAFTSYSREATSLAKEAIAKGYRCLMAVGGDGTNNEVINGILQQDIVPSSSIVYCLLPVGTGNDWIKTHGIPRARKAWLEMFLAGHESQQDIGWVEYQKEGELKRHYFANVAGLAYDAFVVHYVEALKTHLANKLIYLWVVLRCLWKYQLRKAKLLFKNQTVEDYFYTINIGVCRYSGGGMQFVPHADPKDGLLALTYAGKLKKWQVIWNTYRFYNGSIGSHPLVYTDQVEQVTIESEGTLLEVDGEYLGKTPAQFGITKQALRFICPSAPKN